MANGRPGQTVILVGGDRGLLRIAREAGFRPLLAKGREEALALADSEAILTILDLSAVSEASPAPIDDVLPAGRPLLVICHPDTARQLAGRAGVHLVEAPVSQATFEVAARGALGQPAPSPVAMTELDLLGLSPKMEAVRAVIPEIAGTDAAVLILGESGVGKDLVARAIHACSDRREHPFVKVNCAALPSELLESELFGYEKGAFTGAYQRQPGKFEVAGKGTMFLDEIGELPRPLQAKLLHVLQDLEFYRIGGREAIRVESRVIASTNRNLEAAMAAGEFREDLYYRLNVVEIRVPPLRERREEIPLLVRIFLDRFNRQYVRDVKLDAETLALFESYSWPGNVRELENMMRRFVVLGKAEHLRDELRTRLRASTQPAPTLPGAPSHGSGTPSPGLSLSLGLKEIARQAAQDAERKALGEVLERVRWNRAEASRVLKVSYKTLLNKMAELGMDRK